MGFIEDFIQNDRFSQLLGIELLEAADGNAKARMTISEKHLNGHNILHGGAIFSLADLAFAAACNSHGQVALALNVNISFLKAVKEGVVYAKAVERSVNPKIGTYDIEVRHQDGSLIAIFHGMAYRKKEKVGEER